MVWTRINKRSATETLHDIKGLQQYQQQQWQWPAATVSLNNFSIFFVWKNKLDTIKLFLYFFKQFVIKRDAFYCILKDIFIFLFSIGENIVIFCTPINLQFCLILFFYSWLAFKMLLSTLPVHPKKYAMAKLIILGHLSFKILLYLKFYILIFYCSKKLIFSFFFKKLSYSL